MKYIKKFESTGSKIEKDITDIPEKDLLVYIEFFCSRN
jgi:hypothetical protein